MPTPPDISIVTPWLDHPQFIADYETAVAASGVEVIVVDNGSGDAAAKEIRQMVERLKGKYIRNEENRWFAGANNQGLAEATGRIVLFLNNDIAGDPVWLESVREDVEPGALYGPVVLSIDVDERPIYYHEGWCVAALQEVWDALGGWDARTHSMPYWEDNDLGYRAAQAGLKLIQTGWPVRHKGKGTSIHVPGVRHGFDRVRESFFARVRGTVGPSDVEINADDAVTFQQAIGLQRAGRLPGAERAFRKLVEQEPDNSGYWAGYAQVLHLSGRHEAAVKALRRSVELAPANVSYWINLGAVLGRMEKYEEAAEAVGRAAELAPQSPEARNNLSRAYFCLKKYEAAAEAARQAIERKPDFMPAYVNLSNALRAIGQFPGAIEAANSAIQLNPSATTAFIALGAALRDTGRLREALASFRKALALSAHDSIAQQNLQELEQMIAKSARRS